MKKIRKLIKSKEDFNRMTEFLLLRIINNQGISQNAMLDGMVIGFIAYTPFAWELFSGQEIGRVLDGTLQRLEQIVVWVENNEDEICEILEN